MADPNTALRAAGRLFLDPTDMGEPDMGGTELGVYAAARAIPNVRTVDLLNPGRPAAPLQTLYGGEDWHLAVVLRSWTDDVLRLVFPNTASGADGTRNVVDDYTGSLQPGMPLPAYTLLFVPDDRENVPALVFLAAQPALDETAELALGATFDLRLVTLWRARRSSGGLASGRSYVMGSFANLRDVLGI